MTCSRYGLQKVRDVVCAALKSRFTLHSRWKMTPDQLALHQRKRLARVLAYAKRHSPFYACHLQDIDPAHARITDLPILTKPMMMEHYNDLITDQRLQLDALTKHLEEITHDCYYQNRYKVFRSGGSSRLQAIMAYSAQEFSWVLAQILRSSKGRVSLPEKRRLRGANIYARNPTHDSVRISQSFQIGFHTVRDLPADLPTQDLVQALNAFDPDILNGYPSVITDLAHEKMAHRLQIRPKTIFLGSEPLTQSMRETIVKGFGVEPHDHYGTTEAIILATECRFHRGLHLEEDMHLIEIMDENNQPVRPGEPGVKVLVTNLYAFTQPIIRYEVSDILIIENQHGACTCGTHFRTLSRVLGRSDDRFRFLNTARNVVVIEPEDLRLAMAKCRSVRQFQIIQRKNEIVVNALLHDPTTTNRSRDEIIKALSTLLQESDIKISRISCAFVEAFPRAATSSQKFRQIYCEEKC